MMGDNAILPQLLRYGVVGLIVLAADFAAYAVALWAMPGAVVPANVLGKLVGAATGFVLHRSITFRGAKRHGTQRQLASYIALLLFNMAMSSTLLWLLVDRLGCDPYLSKIAVDVIVIGTAFLGSRLLVWRQA